MHRCDRAEARVAPSVHGEQGLARRDDAFGDRTRKFRVRDLAGARARGVDVERAARVAQDQKAALGAQELYRMADDLRSQARELELARKLAVHLEDASEALLERRQASSLGQRLRGAARAKGGGAGGRRQARKRGERQELGGGVSHRPGYAAAKRPAPRIVPVHFTQIARQPRADFFERRQRFLAITAREQRLPALFLELRARLQRAPNPLALRGAAGGAERRFQRITRAELVAEQRHHARLGQEQERTVRGGIAEQRLGRRDAAPKLRAVGVR